MVGFMVRCDTIPCVVTFSCYFAPSQTYEPKLTKCALKAAKLLGRLVKMPAQSSPFPHVASENDCRTLKIFDVPSATYATLAGRGCKEIHWDATTNIY